MSKNFTYQNIFTKAGFVLLGVALSFIIVEILLRIILPHETTLKFYDNPVFGSALVSNQQGIFATETKEYSSNVSINSQGWPDIEHNPEKPEGVKRIIILGDSFVENFQVPFEKRFFRQLQNKLGNNIEIIAIGRGDTGTAQQYLILKEYGLKYKPDIVIQMFLTANDVKNNSQALQNDPYRPYFKIDEDGSLKEVRHIKRSDRRLTFLKDLFKKSKVIKNILSFRQRIIEKKTTTLSGGYPPDYHIYDQEYSSEYKNAWKVTKELIIETKKITEESGAKYILVTLANNEQVNSEVQEQIFKTYPAAKGTNLDFGKPDEILTEFCNETSLTCWQMLPIFKDYLQRNPKNTTHFFYDGHWNQTGTDIAAEFLDNNLKTYLSREQISSKK